jgi:outer membrane protein assembly factor BamB
VAKGVLFVADSGHLWALDSETGKVLWTSTQVGGIHWEGPVVADGWLYLTDEGGSLTAFALAP